MATINILYAQEIKKVLKNDSIIKEVVNIAKDAGNERVKICGIRDLLLHKITGFYWDEIDSKS